MLEDFAEVWYYSIMPMTNVKLRIPSSILPFLEDTDEKTRLVQFAMLLFPYVSNNTISYGKVAELLGVSKFEIMEIYGNAGIPYYNCEFSQVLADSDAIDSVLEKK